MPTYQYACTACDERLEVVQSFSDAALTECPACTGRLRKVFSAVGVVFKGSGFYKTDSRAGSGTTGEAKADASASSDAAASDKGGKGAKADAKGSSDGSSSGTASTSGGSGGKGAGAGSSSGAPTVSTPASKSA